MAEIGQVTGVMMQVCRRLLQEFSRHEGARCRKNSQVTLNTRVTFYCYSLLS